MRRKRKIINICLLLFLVSSCKNGTTEEVAFPEEFRKEVDRVLSSDKDSIIDLSEISLLNWDKLYVFKPYTPIDSIDSVLGVKWEKAESTLIDQSDQNNLLTFVKNKDIVGYAIIPRRYGDFMRLRSYGPFKIDQARFKVSKEIYGNQEWIFLYPVSPGRSSSETRKQ